MPEMPLRRSPRFAKDWTDFVHAPPPAFGPRPGVELGMLGPAFHGHALPGQAKAQSTPLTPARLSLDSRMMNPGQKRFSRNRSESQSNFQPVNSCPWFLLVIAILIWNDPVRGQGQTTTPPALAAATAPAGPLGQAPFLAAAMSELFSDSRPFSAVAVVQLPGDQPNQGIPLGFATLDGKMRWYLNLDQARTSRLDADITEWLREAKLSQIVLILRPQTNALVVLPGLKQWFEFAPPKPEGIEEKAREKAGFLQKTEVGRETVEGHPCVKFRLDLPKERGPGEVAYVWQATDLKNLPIQFRATINGETYGLLFRQIKDAPPEARYFEAPADYAKISGPAVLLQNALLGRFTDETFLGGGLLPSLNLLQLLGLE